MSSFSQFGAGGSGLPIGAMISALDMPVNFSSGGAEYLRAGALKAYDSSYAAAIAAAPQLRVFGNATKTKASTVGTTGYTSYSYVGTNYVAISGNGVYYSSDLSSWTNVSTVTPNQSLRRAASSGSYIVVPASASNTAPQYSSNGSTFSAVGGTWTTCPAKSAIAFGNNIWVALSSLNGTNGEQAYIAAANPSGAWTVAASTNLGITTVAAVAYGASVFVAVGDSGSGAGKIATCSTPAGGWTDRTTSSGITFQQGEVMNDVVFDGTAFVASTSAGRILASTDGVSWTDCSCFDLSEYSQVGTLIGSPRKVVLASDGVGTVVAMSGGYDGNSAKARSLIAISTDHGVTWSQAQVFAGKAPLITSTRITRSISFANSRWLANQSGAYQSVVDLGTSFATPDYIGVQNQAFAGQYVRIK